MLVDVVSALVAVLLTTILVDVIVLQLSCKLLPILVIQARLHLKLT